MSAPLIREIGERPPGVRAWTCPRTAARIVYLNEVEVARWSSHQELLADGTLGVIDWNEVRRAIGGPGPWVPVEIDTTRDETYAITIIDPPEPP